MALTESQWLELQNDSKNATLKRTGADEISDLQNSPVIKALLEANEVARAWHASACGPARYVLDQLAAIQPLDRSRGGAMLVSDIQSTATELRKLVGSTSFDTFIKWIDDVKIERLRNHTIESFTATMERELANNKQLSRNVKAETDKLEFFVSKYFERLQAKGPLYSNTQVAQAGTAPATGGDEVKVISNKR